MIVEQLLHLGYPAGIISYSLASVAKRLLGIDIDKTIRGQIIWRGLDTEVIKYAATDVVYLEDIMLKQQQECKNKGCIIGAKLECDFVPAIAYLEWCGIKLDEAKWKAKMNNDKINLVTSKKVLDDYIISIPRLSKYTKVELQGSLFDGFDTDPKCIINWDSSQQVIKVAIANEVKVLVLGAFGCGVFKNDPNYVAKEMFRLLKTEGYDKYFEEVIFAMNENKGKNVEAFKRTFNLK